jgi:hypothetical protein
MLFLGVKLEALGIGCDEHLGFANISGNQDTAKLSGRQSSSCNSNPGDKPASGAPNPFYTYQIVCSTDKAQAMEGVCSSTPCPNSFFALRTIHFPDGRTEPAGFQCVTLDQATARPGVTAAQVFAAVRRVKLPGGEIEVMPEARGLANLESFFWLRGANQPPVDLEVGGSTVHAEFRAMEYRWSFGDGQDLVSGGPGEPGQGSEVHTAFRRRGWFRVGVTVVWVADAWLDGRRVGQVDDLVSRSQTNYPVAEIQTVLTG